MATSQDGPEMKGEFLVNYNTEGVLKITLENIATVITVIGLFSSGRSC